MKTCSICGEKSNCSEIETRTGAGWANVCNLCWGVIAEIANRALTSEIVKLKTELSSLQRVLRRIVKDHEGCAYYEVEGD